MKYSETHSFSFRAYNYADPSSYSGPDQKHHYNEQNENPYDYVAPRQNSAPRSRTSPNQNAVYARPYASPDRHSREGSYDRGRSFMNQIYMDTEQLQKLRARQENHPPPTSNHGNREVTGARDSGYPGPERPRWGGYDSHIGVFCDLFQITGSAFQGSLACLPSPSGCVYLSVCVIERHSSSSGPPPHPPSLLFDLKFFNAVREKLQNLYDRYCF